MIKYDENYRIHPLLSNYSSTKGEEEKGALLQGGDRRDAYRYSEGTLSQRGGGGG